MVIVAIIVIPLQFIGSLLNGVVFDAKTETVQSFGHSIEVLQPRSLASSGYQYSSA